MLMTTAFAPTAEDLDAAYFDIPVDMALSDLTNHTFLTLDSETEDGDDDLPEAEAGDEEADEEDEDGDEDEEDGDDEEDSDDEEDGDDEDTDAEDADESEDHPQDA